MACQKSAFLDEPVYNVFLFIVKIPSFLCYLETVTRMMQLVNRKPHMNKWQLVHTLLLNCRHFMQIIKLFQLCQIAKVNRFYHDASFDL